MSVLVRINKGLGKLYEARGRKDYYLNGKGLFTKYCEEYGYDDKLIEGELKTAADECMLIDFCKEESGENEDSKDEHNNNCKYNFPFKNQSASIEDQQQIIYETLTSFIINNSRPSTPTEQLPNHKRPIHINLDFQSNDYELTLQLYKKHAYNSLGQHGMNEESLMNLLTISRVNNNFPFMRYLSDSFQRDRIKHHINNESTLTVFKWFKSKKYFQNMSDEKPNKADQTKQAIDGYCNRILPILSLAPLLKIDDSIKLISQYLIITTILLKKMCTEYETVLPFQFDLIIRLRNIVAVSNDLLMPDNSINDEDEEKQQKNIKDDDDDEDPDYQGPKEQEWTPIDYDHDYVGNVKQKIVYEKLCHMEESMYVDHGATSEEAIKILAIKMQKAYRRFKRKVEDERKDRYKKNDENSAEINNKQEQPEIYQDEQAFSWPTRRRLCAYIDGRSDDLLLYEPPNDAKIFPDPDEYISEWQFENLSKCIIPRKGYGNGSKEKENLDNIKEYDVKKRAKFATITSRESCQGQLMTFSFQVTQSDEICCYLIWNGSHYRFYPQDIIELLPIIFVDKVSWRLENDEMKQQQMKLVYDNEAFKNSVEAKKFAEMMDIEDLPFESFYADLCELDQNEFPKYNQNGQNNQNNQ